MFSNNKIIRAQQKRLAATNAQRENLLLQQHKDQEHLLLSMFPKDVARDLIERYRAEYNHGSSRTVIQAMNPVGNLCQTVARMHHDVTILFTDIVGFTPMSQDCEPYEIMFVSPRPPPLPPGTLKHTCADPLDDQFLHSLFSSFDNLIEMDPELWKVETVGDAVSNKKTPLLLHLPPVLDSETLSRSHP